MCLRSTISAPSDLQKGLPTNHASPRCRWVFRKSQGLSGFLLRLFGTLLLGSGASQIFLGWQTQCRTVCEYLWIIKHGSAACRSKVNGHRIIQIIQLNPQKMKHLCRKAAIVHHETSFPSSPYWLYMLSPWWDQICLRTCLFKTPEAGESAGNADLDVSKKNENRKSAISWFIYVHLCPSMCIWIGGWKRRGPVDMTGQAFADTEIPADCLRRRKKLIDGAEGLSFKLHNLTTLSTLAPQSPHRSILWI